MSKNYQTLHQNIDTSAICKSGYYVGILSTWYFYSICFKDFQLVFSRKELYAFDLHVLLKLFTPPP